MFDPDSDDASRLRLAESGVDRDVKIEQLLLAGLDHYFNAQYEQAMDVWTRVLFLDRGHARAGAYIERARAALGERQREADELVHTGVAAFNRGNVGEARERLTSALERGGQHDEALVLLDRLSRLEVSRGSADQQVTESLPIRRRRGTAAPRVGRAPTRAVGIWPIVLLLGVVAGGVYGSWDRLEAVLRPDRIQPRVAVVPGREEPLAVPAASESALSHARALFEEGQLREALRALNGVRPGDSLRSEADLLRSAVQRALLAGSGEPADEVGVDGVSGER